jgi:hypothetical protein
MLMLVRANQSISLSLLFPFERIKKKKSKYSERATCNLALFLRATLTTRAIQERERESETCLSLLSASKKQ